MTDANWKPYILYAQSLGIKKSDIFTLFSVDNKSSSDSQHIKKVLPILLFIISDILGKAIALISSHVKYQPLLILGLNVSSFTNDEPFVVFGSLYYSALFVSVRNIYESKRKKKVIVSTNSNSSNKEPLCTKTGSVTKHFMGKYVTSADFVEQNDILTNRLVDLPYYQMTLMQLLCQSPIVNRILMKCHKFTKTVKGQIVPINKGEVLLCVLEYALEKQVQTEISLVLIY